MNGNRLAGFASSDRCSDNPKAGRQPSRPAAGLRSEAASDQLLLTDVSSTTKLVWSEESSTIRNFTVIVLPL